MTDDKSRLVMQEVVAVDNPITTGGAICRVVIGNDKYRLVVQSRPTRHELVLERAEKDAMQFVRWVQESAFDWRHPLSELVGDAIVDKKASFRSRDDVRHLAKRFFEGGQQRSDGVGDFESYWKSMDDIALT